MATNGEQPFKNILLRDLIKEHHLHHVKGALSDNFLDGYVFRTNVVFRNIRRVLRLVGGRRGRLVGWRALRLVGGFVVGGFVVSWLVVAGVFAGGFVTRLGRGLAGRVV